MTLPSLEYCSLHYLNQWLTHDRRYCKAIWHKDRNQKFIALDKAASFYKVARNLPTKYDVKKGLRRYEPVLDVLDSITESQLLDNPQEAIINAEKAISNEYGGRKVLSLTTKFLWLKFRRPVLIYDTQARLALKGKEGDIMDYYSRWREDFEASHEEIRQVCSRLPEMTKYTLERDTTKDEIRTVSDQPWFHERVFDIRLWLIGS